MIKSYLFDLDDTLLPYSCSQEEILEVIVNLFASYYAQKIHPEQSVPAFIKSVEAMDEKREELSTNLEVYSRTFSSLVDFPKEKVGQSAIDFYLSEATKLKDLTAPSEYARKIMDLLFQENLEVVIATGFQAPMVAAEIRLGWAGIPVTDYDYSFISTWDNMHASKPHLEFYQEILDHIDRDPNECIYVGDSWEDEIVPSSKLGMKTYWVVESTQEPPEELPQLLGFGLLSQFYEWLVDRLN
jgi:HAD superfamily hydrolase (TIGR01549 family)